MDEAVFTRISVQLTRAVLARSEWLTYDFKALSAGYRQLLDFATFKGPDYAFVVIVANRKLLREQPETARKFVRALGNSIDWWYVPGNKDAAIDILQVASKSDRQLAEQTYDYYFNTIKTPFAKGAKVQLPGQLNLLDLLHESGGIKDKNPAKYIDANYLPR